MIRRFNFTERKRIEKERIGIEITAGPASFKAELSLTELNLPPQASVVIEAYRGRAAARFPWGTVEAPTPAENPILEGMPENLTFRVKVIAPDGSGRLLAIARKIRPHQEKQHGSLVWLQSKDLGKEVWRLDYGEGNPTLLINSRVEGIEDAVRRDDTFRSLVMPQVLRSVLARSLVVEDARPDDEEGDWADLFRFVRSFYQQPLQTEEADGNLVVRTQWIEKAVAAFTQTRFPASDAYARALARS